MWVGIIGGFLNCIFYLFKSLFDLIFCMILGIEDSYFYFFLYEFEEVVKS